MARAQRFPGFFVLTAGASALLSCSGPLPADGTIQTQQSPIAYGTPDTTHTAVVALLSPIGTNQLQECTGSIVGVSGNLGYVLTAAHCCNAHPPSVVVAGSDYSVGEALAFGGTPSPPVYSVVAESVYYDAQYAGAGTAYDFCMLSFLGATASTPVLGLPASANDGLTSGVAVEHIGYGATETNASNSARRTGTDSIDQGLDAFVYQFSQGGSTHIPGTCAGDSGGPALLPAGAAQSVQTVVGVQSYGNATTCVTETLGGGSRVSSEIGSGRFITSYVDGTPVGVKAAPPNAPAGGPGFAAALALALAFVASQTQRRPSAPPPR
jgi:hypothetical protein